MFPPFGSFSSTLPLWRDFKMYVFRRVSGRMHTELQTRCYPAQKTLSMLQRADQILTLIH